MPDREMLERLQQARFDDERAHLIQIRNDILWFCDAIRGLITQIRTWMRGHAISTLPSVTVLTDKSISLWPGSSPVSYEISTLSLQRTNATAELLPLAVYGEPGSRGKASLTMMLPGGRPSRLAYLILLDRRTSCWMIRPDGEPQSAAVPLDKNTLRTVLSPMRQYRTRPRNGRAY